MGNILTDSKKDLIIAYIMRFSDQLGDYFYDLGNDDLEHHLENLEDKELIRVYKDIKEEMSMQESKNIQEDNPSIDEFVEKIKKLFKSYGLNIFEKRMFRNENNRYVVADSQGDELFTLSLSGRVLTLRLNNSNNILNKYLKSQYTFELNNTFEVSKLKEHLKRVSDLLLKYSNKAVHESKTIKKSDLTRLVEQLVKECCDLSEEEEVIEKDKKITKMVRADILNKNIEKNQ